MLKSTKILIALSGGGSGGHVFPLLAVAQKILEKNPKARFVYYGSGAGAEDVLKLKKEINFRKIICGKFRRNISLGAILANIGDFFKLIIGFFQSLCFLLNDRPQVVFSKGGYVSLPLVWAAGLLGIPIIAHESDIMPGLANRLGFRFARRIAKFSSKRFIAAYPCVMNFLIFIVKAKKTATIFWFWAGRWARLA